ncbi:MULTISPECIES: hypothetical protein [Streptomyces]|uniref:Uncharacterized protein n=1 Tax=Streptomyces ehimensis TaxID=68195 RepID=A0ABV9BUP4_9ACTN
MLTSDQVAAAKWLSGRTIEDPVRERQVQADMRTQVTQDRELGIDLAATH